MLLLIKVLLRLGRLSNGNIWYNSFSRYY